MLDCLLGATPEPTCQPPGRGPAAGDGRDLAHNAERASSQAAYPIEGLTRAARRRTRFALRCPEPHRRGSCQREAVGRRAFARTFGHARECDDRPGIPGLGRPPAALRTAAATRGRARRERRTSSDVSSCCTQSGESSRGRGRPRNRCAASRYTTRQASVGGCSPVLRQAGRGGWPCARRKRSDLRRRFRSADGGPRLAGSRAVTRRVIRVICHLTRRSRSAPRLGYAPPMPGSRAGSERSATRPGTWCYSATGASRMTDGGRKSPITPRARRAVLICSASACSSATCRLVARVRAASRH